MTAAARPDIVVFMTDQQRFDQVGYASDGLFETPVLDALAARGVVFDTAYSASTTCVPARNALLTGIQPGRLPTQHNPLALREGMWTVAHALRGAGYDTALIGKMHFTPMHADHGFDVVRTCEHLNASFHALRPDGGPDLDDYHQWLVERGWATWRPLTVGGPPEIDMAPPPDPDCRTAFPYTLANHPTTWIEHEVGAYLDARTGDRPLFLVVSFPHPHGPLNPPEPYASMYDPDEVDVPVDGLAVNDALPGPFRESIVGPGAMGGGSRLVDEVGERRLRAALTKTRALVRHIDDAMGRLLPRFDLDETLVLFTSDHGDYGGHRGLLGKSPWIPFDHLIRVPLVAAGRGVVGGRRIPAIVQSCDLALTCCEAAGVAVPVEEFDTRSLVPFLTGRTTADDLDRTVVCNTTMGWAGMRRGRAKLILHAASFTMVAFDLDADPLETVNVLDVPEYRDEAVHLFRAMEASTSRGRPDLPWFGAARPEPVAP